MAHDPRILDLMLAYEDLGKQGQSVTPEELCRDCPELVDEVRRCMHGFKLLEPVLGDTAIGNGPIHPPIRDRELPDWGEAPLSGFDVGQRYRPVRFHARGGLGEVHVAEDKELHRQVALKRIQARCSDDEESRRRFLREAEITARLEHPGVVPVHGLVHDESGQPWYAMRFIEGESLKDLIGRFHEADQKPRRDQGERNLALRQLLNHFLAVCKTVAYAHNRGIIHRDLKPANIMLGKYGETLVVDWGLAKSVERSKEARETGEETLQPTSPSDHPATRTGAVAGTPAYMSPEQARGAAVGPPADIFSLGATLYSVLTGRPPYQGPDALDQAKEADYPQPRQLNPSTPAALAAVCVKALAVNPDERYPTALVMADDIEHWLADEPVSARREPLRTRLARWGRRNKALVSSGAVAVLVGLIALTAGIIWYQGNQAEAERKLALSEQGIEQALDQAEAVRDDLQKKLRQRGGVFELLNHPEDWQARIKMAHAGLDRATALLVNAGEEVDRELKGRANQLERLLQEDEGDRLFAVRLEKIRMDKAMVLAGKFISKNAVADYPRAFAGAGLGVVDGDRDQVVQRILPMPIKEQVVAALDDWAWSVFVLGDKVLAEKLVVVARAVAPDPKWGDRLRQTRIWRNQDALASLAKNAPAAELSPQMFELLGALLDEKKTLRQTWLRQAQARFPADFWLNFHLAHALAKSQPVEAAGFYRVALAVRPGNSAAHNNLGFALYAQQKLPEAIVAFRKAIDRDPKSATAYCNLGAALYAQQKLPEAIAAFSKAIALDPKFVPGYFNLGAALYDQKKLPEAIAAYRNAIALNPNLPMASFNLGNALSDLKNLAGAIAAYRNAITLDPKFASAYYNLGNALSAQQKLPEAISAYRNAINLDPKHANAYTNLGNALSAQQKLPEAVAAYRNAIILDPKNARAYHGLGAALGSQWNLPEAIAAYRNAIDLYPPSDPHRSACLNRLKQCQQRQALEKRLPLEKQATAPFLVVSKRTGHTDIFLIDVDVAGALNLTKGTGECSFPAWSRDGKRIAFASDQNGAMNIYVMDADGANMRQLTKGTTNSRSPSWSFDNKKIAFMQEAQDTQETPAILVMDASGSNVKQVGTGYDPALSPDGKHILFARRTGKGFHLCVMDVDGANVRRLSTADNKFGYVHPAWSLDGKKVAWADEGTGSLEIFIADADGNNARQLTNLGGSNMFPAWSPDGKKIAFYRNGQNEGTYCVVDTDGGNLVELLWTEAPIEGARLAWRLAPAEKKKGSPNANGCKVTARAGLSDHNDRAAPPK